MAKSERGNGNGNKSLGAKGSGIGKKFLFICSVNSGTGHVRRYDVVLGSSSLAYRL